LKEGFNITSNTVPVGIAKTDVPLDDEVRLKLEERLWLGRIAELQLITGAMEYLVSDKPRYTSRVIMNLLRKLKLLILQVFNCSDII
jgi:hypothetical protein